MKFVLSARVRRGLFAALLLVSLSAFEAQAKLIRLRNEFIQTSPGNSVAAAKSAASSAAVSGLYLVQFHGTLSQQSRAQLAALGVDLLQSVPEDAFVARFRNVPMGQLAALPIVEWVGVYRPEHKIHRALLTQSQAKTTPGTNSLAVTILLVPRAAPAEIAAARSSLSTVQQASTLRSGTILRGQLNPGRLQALLNSDSVLWVESAPRMKLVDEVASKIVAGDGGFHTLLPQTLGFDGAGVKVAVADSGLNNGDAATMHPDLLGRTPAFFWYGALTDAADEHSHGTHVAGIVAGNGATGEVDENGALYGLGVAPGASIIAQRMFDGVGNAELPPSFERLTRDATRAGADIGSNSWGDDTQGRYDVSAMEFDELVRDADALKLGDQPYILEFSAGNAGPGVQTIGSPAVAKNVLATGASENDRPDLLIYADGPEFMADFSSRGPCEDGRIKPDLVAPGTWISSLQSQSATDEFAWAPIDSLYQYQGGTSQAGPHAAGAAAIFVQFYRRSHNNSTPSPALVKAALINSATPLDPSFGNSPVPNMDQGWGRVDLLPLLDPAVTFLFTDQTVLLTNSQVFERHVLISGPDQPLRVTLAYTDVPGFPGAIPALVNDLDLEVVAPDGSVYRGNQFVDGESIPNAPAADSINNVEGVNLSYPLPGDYTVRVRARNIVQDAREDTAAVDQDFALVISGAVAAPTTGYISLDHASYTAPSRIRIVVIDTDQAGRPSINVLAQSTTETVPESVILLPQTPSGVFTGSIATATGPAVADGRLQIAHGDGIEVIYSDASASASRFATAVADLVPPVLTGVSASGSFGQVTVSWSSDEPATSTIWYGTNPVLSSLTSELSNPDLTTTHSIDFGRLVPGKTYYYFVASADEAGNISTNNNAGAFFTFVAPTTATVLLVDEYQDELFGVPPISGYTDPLNQIGVSYDLWDTAVHGAPTLTNLLPYRAVIWRVSEFFSVWSPDEQLAISNYVHSGGGFFVASMEVLSRLETAGATGFIHNVLQVQSYLTDETGSTGAAQIIGTPGAPLAAGMDVVMDYSVYETLWGGLLGPDLSDTITPSTNAMSILQNDVGDNVGLCWPGLGRPAPGRLVFLSFPLDAVPMNGGVNDRVSLLRDILIFLAPGAPGLPSLTLDSPAYSLPGRVTIRLGDSSLAGLGSADASAFSTTQTNSLSVTLLETSQPGLFTGSFDLISDTNPPVAGMVRARNNDTVQVRFIDPASSTTLSAAALVDTVPPGISNITPDPDYQQAYIYWDTSEITDALVQFGESPGFLNRSAYDSTPGTFHAVTLPALGPNSLYYFRVVSRDLAGNTAIDDNQGKLYTFRTLLPLEPPWSDNLDSGAHDWTVYTAEGSQTEWTLGVPDNGEVTEAHSPPNCYGSNLGGQSVDLVESFLISPAIYLTNGNLATLTFWHWYDFSDPNQIDIIHGGEVDVVVNDSATTIPIAAFSDFSGGWVEEKVDLTPYLGQIVYLAWHYVLFSLESQPRPGWLVDDVSITVSTIAPGTIVISNNLAQATYVLSGPLYMKSKGAGTVITNAPPGQYTIEFADVPYYFTPAPQTNTLASYATISFQGTYTFPDANHNGMSDLWETNFFGTVSPTRTEFTDTDGDGMTDYAEFIAGTNPNDPQSNLKVSAQQPPNGPLNLAWSAVAGRGYLVLHSSDGQNWTPASGLLRPRATGTMNFPVESPAPGAGTLYRVEVRP
ncbi:MAG TPA: S8 family serine peptidase [Verrucomicrobiae bacterium]